MCSGLLCVCRGCLRHKSPSSPFPLCSPKKLPERGLSYLSVPIKSVMAHTGALEPPRGECVSFFFFFFSFLFECVAFFFLLLLFFLFECVSFVFYSFLFIWVFSFDKHPATKAESMIFKWGIQTWTQGWGGGSQVGRGTCQSPQIPPWWRNHGSTLGPPRGQRAVEWEACRSGVASALPSDSSGVTPVSSSYWLLATLLPSRLTHCWAFLPMEDWGTGLTSPGRWPSCLGSLEGGFDKSLLLSGHLGTSFFS